MTTVTDTQEAEQLVSRMNTIRNVSNAHVAELHQQAQRLGDWREYVRAQPVLSVAAAAGAGFLLIHKVNGSRTATRAPGQQAGSHEKADETRTAFAKAGLTSGLLAFVGSLASAAARQYVLKKLRGMSEHD